MTYINNIWSNNAPDVIKDFKFKNLKKLYGKLEKFPIVEGMNINRDITYLSFKELTQSYQHMFIKFIFQNYNDMRRLVEIIDETDMHNGLYESYELIDGASYPIVMIIPMQGILPEIISKIRNNMPGHKSITIKIASIVPTIDDRLFDYQLTIDEHNALLCNKSIDFTNFEDNIVKYDFMVYLYLFGHTNRQICKENSPKVILDSKTSEVSHDKNSDKKTSKRNHNYYRIKQLPIIRIKDF